MRKHSRTTCAFAIGLALASTAVEAQTLSHDDVAAGLTLATTKKPWDYVVTDGARWYDVTVVGRLGRIALKADTAKREYRPFTAADVPADLLRDEVVVEVVPTKPIVNTLGTAKLNTAPPFSAVVMKTASGAVVQPLSMERTPHTFANTLGVTVTQEGARLTFPPLPAGDFSIVVVTSGGEFVAEFKGKNRQKIQ
jgi:hypothetical protein